MTLSLGSTADGLLTNAVESASLARHRWYPIKEGFSPQLVEDSFKELKSHSPKHVLVIEPFSGSGTSPVECTRLGLECLAFEVNPFLAFVGRTKLRNGNPFVLARQRKVVLNAIRHPMRSPLETYSTFCESAHRKKWLFNRSVLRAFSGGWNGVAKCQPSVRPFLKLALIRAAMDNCNAYPDGKCLRYKRLKNYDCFNSDKFQQRFEEHCAMMEEDIESTPLVSGLSRIVCADSRRLDEMKTRRRFDLCVTSPPYLNSFDYSDVYRPETFLAGYASTNEQLMR